MKELERLELEKRSIESRIEEAHKRYGKWLRLQREHLEISLREFAKKLGVSAPYLSDLERGNRKSSKGLRQKISKLI